MERTFPSKVDGWLAALLIISIIGSFAAVVAASIAEGKQWLILMGLILPISLRLIAFPIRYTFRNEELTILCGLMKMKVPYRSIQSVEPTRSPISAPAFSLDRLNIKHDKGSVMVSPNDKPAFLSELKKRANLRGESDRLTR